MKKFEITIRGEQEEAIGAEILCAVCGAIQNHGYTDVFVKSESIQERKNPMIEMPSFLKSGPAVRIEIPVERREQNGGEFTVGGNQEAVGRCKEPGTEAFG